MKNVLYFFLLLLYSVNISAQDDMSEEPTGLPGDNFSLEGALELFKNASSPEDFEKSLNSKDNHVNNIDIDGDGEIDFEEFLQMMRTMRGSLFLE